MITKKSIALAALICLAVVAVALIVGAAFGALPWPQVQNILTALARMAAPLFGIAL